MDFLWFPWKQANKLAFMYICQTTVTFSELLGFILWRMMNILMLIGYQLPGKKTKFVMF
jgi:hypothetical protein